MTLVVLSLFRINLKILPLGAWMASFAGFSCFPFCNDDAVELELVVDGLKETFDATGPK